MTKVQGTPFILVVEGDPGSADRAVRSLRDAGWEAIGTSDPWEGMQLIAECQLSMIVLDLDLEGVGGSDLCAMIQEDPGMTGIPVLFLSTHAGVIGPKLASFQGHNSCHPKPITGPLLVAATRELLAGPFPREAVYEDVIPRTATRFVRRRRELAPISQSA